MRIDINQEWDSDGNLIESVAVEVPQRSLEGIPLIAALNAAIGVWSLTEASNISMCSEEDLVNEVLAWAVVSNGS